MDENEPLQAMIKDQFANYVIQKVLETCDDHQRELILSRIKIHLNALKKNTLMESILLHVSHELWGPCKPFENRRISINKVSVFLEVIDFVDSMLMERPDSCNPVLLNCLYGSGVIQSMLTTFEATIQLFFAVNRVPTSPMDTDDANAKQDDKEDTNNLWIYGSLASYGKLMDHPVTSSFILSSFTKHLLAQPLSNSDTPFPRDPETFMKVLQSTVLKTVLPVWTHPQFEDDELAREHAMSFGSSESDTKDAVPNSKANISAQQLEEEIVQFPSVDELLSTCTRLLMKEPLAFPVRDLLVMICSQDNDPVAREAASKSVAVSPNFEIAKNNMAIALTDLGTKVKLEGDINRGVAFYKKALFYNLHYADAMYNLGVAYGEMLKFDMAIVFYELAFHFNPHCAEACNNLGVIYKYPDNLDKVVECYQLALSIKPNFSQSLNNLDVVYTVQGKMDAATSMIEKAIIANPTYAEAYNNLGVLYRDADSGNDIEEEMIRAAIEASKRKAEENYSNHELGRQVNLSEFGPNPRQTFVEDPELTHAVSLSLKTAEQEKARRVQEGDIGAYSAGPSKAPAVELGEVSSNGRLQA
ncbi:hypothetical protein RYX36_008321 [Vicia faba]